MSPACPHPPSGPKSTPTYRRCSVVHPPIATNRRDHKAPTTTPSERTGYTNSAEPPAAPSYSTNYTRAIQSQPPNLSDPSNVRPNLPTAQPTPPIIPRLPSELSCLIPRPHTSRMPSNPARPRQAKPLPQPRHAPKTHGPSAADWPHASPAPGPPLSAISSQEQSPSCAPLSRSASVPRSSAHQSTLYPAQLASQPLPLLPPKTAKTWIKLTGPLFSSDPPRQPTLPAVYSGQHHQWSATLTAERSRLPIFFFALMSLSHPLFSPPATYAISAPSTPCPFLTSQSFQLCIQPLPPLFDLLPVCWRFLSLAS